MSDEEPLPYAVLIRIADAILETGEDDPDALAGSLDRLEPWIREELFASDLLNAFQVFYYFFREDPGDLETDRLMLQPASALSTGVVVAEREFYEILFRVENGYAVISVTDGESILASFTGEDAYWKALSYAEEQL
ncbi:MAG: hypothetical protein GKC05_05460 [Methanomicrobiales archaeon]|nr:hypothetical protein [Methanomicrobiales archaeon]